VSLESVVLRDAPVPLVRCPKCGAEPFDPFLRGEVQRNPRKFIVFGPKRPYCALICRKCKEWVGWEAPPGAC